MTAPPIPTPPAIKIAKKCKNFNVYISIKSS
jgi:hypothetical protein